MKKYVQFVPRLAITHYQHEREREQEQGSGGNKAFTAFPTRFYGIFNYKVYKKVRNISCGTIKRLVQIQKLVTVEIAAPFCTETMRSRACPPLTYRYDTSICPIIL